MSMQCFHCRVESKISMLWIELKASHKIRLKSPYQDVVVPEYTILPR